MRRFTCGASVVTTRAWGEESSRITLLYLGPPPFSVALGLAAAFFFCAWACCAACVYLFVLCSPCVLLSLILTIFLSISFSLLFPHLPALRDIHRRIMLPYSGIHRRATIHLRRLGRVARGCSGVGSREQPHRVVIFGGRCPTNAVLDASLLPRVLDPGLCSHRRRSHKNISPDQTRSKCGSSQRPRKRMWAEPRASSIGRPAS